MHVVLIACIMYMKAAESGVYPLENLSTLQDLFEVCWHAGRWQHGRSGQLTAAQGP